MTTELLEIMQKDIKRCEEAQDSNEGTHRLYQALIAKYNGIFEGFEKDIPTSGKAAFGGGEFNYRPELNAIKEKLELLIVTDNDKDPLFNFKVMYEDDLESLKKAISDSENRETPESAKLQLYKDVTAKYHPYIPKLSGGKIRKKRIWKKITRQVRNQKKPARLRTLNSQRVYLYRARKCCLRIKKGIKQLCTTSTFRSNTRHS